MATIATLAQFHKTDAKGYRARTENWLDAYRPERAEEVESDVWDGWAKITFGDGSSLIIRDETAKEA
jgi:hypothetical protein